MTNFWVWVTENIWYTEIILKNGVLSGSEFCFADSHMRRNCIRKLDCVKGEENGGDG